MVLFSWLLSLVLSVLFFWNIVNIVLKCCRNDAEFSRNAVEMMQNYKWQEQLNLCLETSMFFNYDEIHHCSIKERTIKCIRPAVNCIQTSIHWYPEKHMVSLFLIISYTSIHCLCYTFFSPFSTSHFLFSAFPTSIRALVCARSSAVIDIALGSMPSTCWRSFLLCGES